MTNKGFTNDAIPALSACESPIEGKFVQAWFDLMHELGFVVEYPVKSDLPCRCAVEFSNGEGARYVNSSVIMLIQCESAGHRCDVIVCFSDGDNALQAAIELDGAQYHASSERQTLDRRIDRDRVKLGYICLRYSGSDIFSHAAEASREVLEILELGTDKLSGMEHSAFILGLEASERKLVA